MLGSHPSIVVISKGHLIPCGDEQVGGFEGHAKEGLDLHRGPL